MDEQEKEKAINQFKVMLSQWLQDDSQFRNYTKRRSEALKMLGGGNASGLLAVAVFLTTGSRAASALTAGKYCVVVFLVGFAAFMLAYRNFYRFESDVEDAMILLWGGADLDDSSVKKRIESALGRSERSGKYVALTLGCFVIGGLVCCLGLLMN
jgi:hypothetical protein